MEGKSVHVHSKPFEWHLCSLLLLQTVFKCPTLFLSGMHGALSPSLHFEAQNYLTVTRVYSRSICYYHRAQTHKELMCLIYLFTMGSQGHRCAVDERELFFSIEVEIPQVFCQKNTSGFFVIFFCFDDPSHSSESNFDHGGEECHAAQLWYLVI